MFDYFYGQSGEMFSYFRVPKILFRDIKFKDLSTDAKTLYGILLDRMGLSVKNGWLDEQGRVYIIFPVQEVMDALGCADNKATKLFRELENAGLVERKRRGLGKPNLIYVKNFADPRFRNREKNGSGAADSAQQETAKSRGNKTEWNKTEGSEPDPFSSDAEDEPDERTRLEAYFMQSLEVDLLLRVCPDEEDTIHQIVNLLVDTCSSKRRMLRVAGDDKPAEVVRSRFMKLNADHISPNGILPFYAQSVQALGKGGSIHVEHDACHVFVECALHVDGRTVSVPLLNEKQLVARSTAEAAGKRCDPYRDTETDRVPQKEQKNSRRGLPVSGGQRRRMG